MSGLQTASNSATTQQKPIHVCILDLFYNASFSEPELLHAARAFRSRDVWEGLKDQAAKRRKTEGFLQRVPGVRCYWEDVLVDFFGLHWRSSRASATWEDWKRNRAHFVNQTCTRWGLRLCDTSAADESIEEPALKRQKVWPTGAKDRLTFRSNLPEPDELMDTVAPLITWSRPQKSFIYVVDSQSLQGVVCGRTRLRDAHYEPLVSRIIDRIWDHLCCKWIPPRFGEIQSAGWKESAIKWQMASQTSLWTKGAPGTGASKYQQALCALNW